MIANIHVQIVENRKKVQSINAQIAEKFIAAIAVMVAQIAVIWVQYKWLGILQPKDGANLY